MIKFLNRLACYHRRLIFATKLKKMKIWFSVLTVSLFLSSIFRPVFPVYDYFLNYDYIVNVLCINRDKPEMHCDGKCYLKKEFSENNELNNPTKKALVNYEFKLVPVYLERSWDYHLYFVLSDQTENIFFKINPFEKVSIEPNLPPPRV